jgi:hypothetical protein
MGDFNGDGKSDVLWTSTAGGKYIWLLDGLTVIGNSLLPAIDPGWTVVSGK